MEQTINERFIKLSSRIPFDKDIALGDDLTFLIEGKQFIANCVKIDHLDQQDGTMNIVYNLKFLSEWDFSNGHSSQQLTISIFFAHYY